MNTHEKRVAIRALAFADGFAVHRRRKGWTLREAGEAIGMAHGALHDIETGRKTPGVEALYMLCHSYGLPFLAMVEEMGAVRAGNQARRAGLLK